MITFKVIGTTVIGRLEQEKFSVPGDPQTESILNNLASLHPIATVGNPDEEYDFFEHILSHWPFLEIISRDQPPPQEQLDGRVY